jgi:hypothetical protein
MQASKYLGAIREKTNFNNEVSIDNFPIIVTDDTNVNKPGVSVLTLYGKTFRLKSYEVGNIEHITIEVSHTADVSPKVNFHIRLLPTTNTEGTVNFTFTYVVQNVQCVVRDGGDLNLTEKTIATNDYANGIGQCMHNLFPSNLNLKGGDMVIGKLERTAGTYAGAIALTEIGSHTTVNATGMIVPNGE